MHPAPPKARGSIFHVDQGRVVSRFGGRNFGPSNSLKTLPRASPYLTIDEITSLSHAIFTFYTETFCLTIAVKRDRIPYVRLIEKIVN